MRLVNAEIILAGGGGCSAAFPQEGNRFGEVIAAISIHILLHAVGELRVGVEERMLPLGSDYIEPPR